MLKSNATFVSLHVTICACAVSRSPAPDEHRLCLFATTLICAVLVILRGSTPIGAVLELRSRANLPCLVNLALNVL